MGRLNMTLTITNIWVFFCLVSETQALSNQHHNPSSTRNQFLSSSAASFLAATTFEPKPSHAAKMDSKVKDNPRYIDSELEMKYADDGSKSKMKVMMIYFSSKFV